MNTMKKAVTGLMLGAGALASGQALAAVNGSVAATSDYMFRGLDASSGAAVQGSLTWNNPTGFYAGGWASNVTGGPVIPVGGNEFDAYMGWSTNLSNGVNVDVGAIYYYFSEHDQAGGTNNNPSYPEVYVGASFAGLSAKIFYANEYFGDASKVGNKDQDSLYTTVKYAYNIAQGLDLAGQVGYSTGNGIENLLANAGGNDDNYWDYSVTLTKNIGDGMAASFAVVDTNIKVAGFEDKPKAVVSFSKAFNL